MIDFYFPQLLLLLGLAVLIVVVFRRLHVPSSLAYLLVGVLLGPYTGGLVIDGEPIRALAEFGIVFLLFTIGLGFSVTQIVALRHQVVPYGTLQVVLTTLLVGAAAWAWGLPVAAAFVVGAVFAQSSTTIISRQLMEQGEEHSRHGRLGTAMSVFQDVTAVPFVVVIPALGVGAASGVNLGMALAQAFLLAGVAIVVVVVLGRWILRPLFHLVVEQRSAELFTLTVLFVSLAAAWATQSVGLSMAFGGFLVGMMLGETEFRHEVEATIRPFRDVLLGLFFVGIGMLLDVPALPQIWPQALVGALLLLGSKVVLVAAIVRGAEGDPRLAWRTGWLLAVGGEFGFALLAIALDAGAIAADVGQIVLASVLLSMIAGPFLIRYNHALVRRLTPAEPVSMSDAQAAPVEIPDVRDHVVICGYGRIGQSVARMLEREGIAFVALDLNPVRVREAHLAGDPVFYGDASEPGMLEAVGVHRARLVVVSYDDVSAALRILTYLRRVQPEVPVMVRTRDESHEAELRHAGATEVVPETLEAGLMIAINALLLLGVPAQAVVRDVQEQRTGRYAAMRELFRGYGIFDTPEAQAQADCLVPVVVAAESAAVGRVLGELDMGDVTVTALVREGRRHLAPPADVPVCAGDVLVLFGPPDAVRRVEGMLSSG